MSITATRNQRKTAKRIQQALRKNPYDTEALFQLACTLETHDRRDLPRKRQILHRILHLEPAHRQARQMLFEMDRAMIGGNPSRLSAAVILTDPSTNDLPEQTLILRYSVVHQILVYLFLACTALASLSGIRDTRILIVIGVCLLLALWSISAVIEINDSGLRVSRLFGMVNLAIVWNEIREYKQTALGQGIQIITDRGKSIRVSAQIQGYPFILDILQQMRPDLFHTAESARTGDRSLDGPAVTSVAIKTVE